MMFAAALFLLGAAGVAVPIWLHLRKGKPSKKVDFPSLRFLEESLVIVEKRSRPYHWLLLLLRMLVVVLIAFAFSMPYFEHSDPMEVVESFTVILVDDSFSMKAFESEVKEKLFAQLDQVDAAHLAIIGIARDQLLWSGEFSEDAAELKNWWGKNSTYSYSSDMGQALYEADRLLQKTVGQNKDIEKRILVLGDTQAYSWRFLRDDFEFHSGLQVLNSGALFDAYDTNVVVQSVSVDPSYHMGSRTLQLNIELFNHSSAELNRELDVSFEGKSLFREEVTLKPSGTVMKVVPLISEEYRNYYGKVSLNAGEKERSPMEKITLDDVFYFSVNTREAKTVFASPHGGGQVDLLKAALNAGKENSHCVFNCFNSVSSSEEEILSAANFVWLRDFDGLGDANNESFSREMPKVWNYDSLVRVLNQGGNVVVDASGIPFVADALIQLGYRWEDSFDGIKVRHMGEIDFKHRLFSGFQNVKSSQLFSLLFYNPLLFELPKNAMVLAKFDSGDPAVIEHKLGMGKLFLLPFSLNSESTNWPTEFSFPQFIQELFSLTTPSGHKEKQFVLESTPITDVAADTAQLLSNKAFSSIPIEDGLFYASKVGNYKVGAADGSHYLSVNVDSKESSIKPMEDGFSLMDFENLEPAQNEVLRSVKSLGVSSISESGLDEPDYAAIALTLFLAVIVLLFIELLIANRAEAGSQGGLL